MPTVFSHTQRDKSHSNPTWLLMSKCQNVKTTNHWYYSAKELQKMANKKMWIDTIRKRNLWHFFKCWNNPKYTWKVWQVRERRMATKQTKLWTTMWSKDPTHTLKPILSSCVQENVSCFTGSSFSRNYNLNHFVYSWKIRSMTYCTSDPPTAR